MKRSNIFILAYIAFIMLSAIISSFYDYPMWHRIVVAVTSVSWMLSLSDGLFSFSSLSKEMKDLVPIIEKQYNQIDQLLQFWSVTQKNDSIEKRLSGLKNRYSAIKKRIISLGSKGNTFKNYAIGFSFVAFLLFMLVLCFEPLYVKLIKIQDFTTVMSFGLILLIQYAIDYWTNCVKEIQFNFVSIGDDLSELLFLSNKIE